MMFGFAKCEFSARMTAIMKSGHVFIGSMSIYVLRENNKYKHILNFSLGSNNRSQSDNQASLKKQICQQCGSDGFNTRYRHLR